MADTKRRSKRVAAGDTKLSGPTKKVQKLQNSGSSKPDSTTVKSRKSAHLSHVIRVYKGLDDWHIPIFRAAQSLTKAKHVLYPGCDKHIVASLMFPSVVYVDFNRKMEPIFKDESVLEWVKTNKIYTETPTIKFLCRDFGSKFEKEGSFDLMISACAGIVSEPCVKYIKVGGHFLVSDSHFDARATFLMPTFELVGVYNTALGSLETGSGELKGHFTTTKGEPITRAQVDESIEKPKNRRSFKLQKEAMFYLFKKLK